MHRSLFKIAIACLAILCCLKAAEYFLLIGAEQLYFWGETLFFLAMLLIIPYRIKGAREGHISIPPQTVWRRKTPKIFWIVVAFHTIITIAVLLYMIVDLHGKLIINR